ncbi:MAG: hypothetical protein ABW022_12580 [Actinoplanes sp.]
MPWPKGDLERPYERQTYDFLTGAGNHAVSSLSTGSRIYAVNWEVLHADTFARVEQYRTGMNGPGPWAFIDPAAPNLLPANVSAATGLYSNATGFVSAGGSSGTISSNLDPTYIHRVGGYRSIRWRWNVAAATTPVLGISPGYRSWWGQPVAPALSYAWSSWIRADGVVDSSITTAMKLQWLDAAGVQVGSVATTGALTVTASWQRLSVIATAPAGTAYVNPTWEVTGSSVTTNASLYIDEPLLEQDSVVNDWAPGTGIKPVEIVSLGEVAPFAARFRTGTAMALRELAR